MTGPLPVKGTEISSAPCSVRKAASLLRRFLSSEAASEVGIAKGYLDTVTRSLEEILARGKNEGTEGSKLETAGTSSKFFNVEQVPKIAEIIKKSRREKESKQKKEDQAMVDFEALLGHELDDTEIGNQADMALGLEAKSEILPSTPRQVDSVDVRRESQKSEKKKKRKSLGGAAMHVDMDGIPSSRKTEVSEPDSVKKSKKRSIEVDGIPSAKKTEASEPDSVKKSKKRSINVDGIPSAKKTEASVPDSVKKPKKRSIEVDGIPSARKTEASEPDSVKKSKKRSIEVSPGSLDDQHRKLKKLKSSA